LLTFVVILVSRPGPSWPASRSATDEARLSGDKSLEMGALGQGSEWPAHNHLKWFI
jgi:hypothetical protein